MTENTITTQSKHTVRSLRKFASAHHSQLTILAMALSSLLLLAVAIYSGIQGGNVHSGDADAYSLTYSVAEWQPGSVLLLSNEHTNLIKMPIFWLQGQLPYNYSSYEALIIALLIMTVFGWSILTMIALRDKWSFIASNLALSGLLLLSTNEIYSLTLDSGRQVEYVIAFGYLLLLRSGIKRDSAWRYTFSLLILTLLVASDHIFLYSLVPGLILLFALLRWRHQLSWHNYTKLTANVVAGALIGLAVPRFLEFIHIFHNLPYLSASSFITFNHLPQQIYNLFGVILGLSGGDFFGVPVKISYGGEVLGFIFVILCIVSAVRLARIHLRVERPKTSVSQTRLLTLGLISYAVLLCVFVVLSNMDLEQGSWNYRYLSVLPFIGTFVVIAYYQVVHNKKGLLIITSIILVGGLMNSFHNYFEYRGGPTKQFFATEARVDKKVIGYLKERHVKLALTTYSYAAPIRFFSQGKVLAYPIKPCNFGLTWQKNAESYWFKPSASLNRSAFVLDTSGFAPGFSKCTLQKLQEIYGTPSSVATVSDINANPVRVLIYNYDIRDKLQH